MTRRGFIAAGLWTAIGMTAGRLAFGFAKTRKGAATPRQIEGPFYPTEDRPDEDADLTRVAGRSGRAEGDVVLVRGRVLDEGGKPILGALVEIWQANTWGRYDHERDENNPRPLDPNFQGWGEVVTQEAGRYGFKTIRPGSYAADGSGWMRPPHIHFKVSRRGYHELITQMYFEGEPLNDKDRIRDSLSP